MVGSAKRVLQQLSKSYQGSWMAFYGNNDDKGILTLAASSASVEEQASSALKDGKFPDGSKPVVVERRIWRAQVKSQYVEPEIKLDPSDELDFLYEQAGKTVLKQQKPLPPRDCLLYTSPSPRDQRGSRMPSSA